MPAIQKRTVETSFPEAKKAKVSVDDPVLGKVAKIAAALESDSFGVPGTYANREMLIAMASAILSTPVDQRNAHQEIAAAMYKEIFATEEARLTQRVGDAFVKVREATEELYEVRKAATSSAETALTKKDEEIKVKLTELAAEVGVTRTAESTLKELSSDLTDLEEIQSYAMEEHQETTNLKTEHFLVLKNGLWEGDVVPKDNIKVLTSLFRKIKADASMVAALPMVLGRRPAERSEFDSLAASELEQKLEAHLHGLEKSIESNVAKIAEKKTLRDAADGAVVAAKAQQRSSTEALLEFKAQQKQLSFDLSEKEQAVVDQALKMKAVDGDFQEEKAGLESHQRISSDLTELLERTTPVVPEVVVEEKAVELATEDMTQPVVEAIYYEPVM